MRSPGLRSSTLLAALLLWVSAGRTADDKMPVGEAAATLRRLYLSGARAEADALVARLAAKAKGDASYSFSLGMALAQAGQLGPAEEIFSLGVAAAPGDFKLLYNLGVAASLTGHYERAGDVLGTALRQQPKNVDLLYNLAYVNEKLKQREVAVRLLAQAAQLAPKRADIQKLLAIATFELRAWGDALAAWDRYLKLQPNDDVARRERGFTTVQMGQFEQGIADLKWFLGRHPNDAEGYYELALAEIDIDPAQALIHLDKAVSLNSDFPAARSARGSLYYQQGKPEAALADLEFAAARQPNDAINLDRLGQSYLALDRPADAVGVLRRAAELAPADSKTQLHFARALADAGATAESKVVMERFRQLGPAKTIPVPAGLVEYLSLSPEQQRADYRSRVEQAVAKDPSDAAAQVRYLKLLLDDGKLDQGLATARRIAALKPGAAVLADAGHSLLQSEQYRLARELLEAAAAGSSSDAQLDLAIATFHLTGAAEGLQLMDRVPEPGRNGDYYLARAQMLDASGRAEESVAALSQALRAAPKSPALYRQAAAFLVKSGQPAEALRLLDQAATAGPQDRESLLMRATTLELARRSNDAERQLKEIQSRWPEWHAVWVAQGVILASQKRFEDARQALETAVTFGARGPETYYYLAECSLRSGPERIGAAEAAIQKALKLAPDDPWIQALAGRIAKRDSSGSGDEPPYLNRLFWAKPPRDW